MKVTPKLGKLLKERNMTQMELAGMTGIPQGSISRFDRNDRHSATHLFAIALALELTVDDLFDVDA